MLFDIFNLRMVKVDWVDAVDTADALKYAKRMYPGASVQRVLTKQEQRQKEAAEEAEFWSHMHVR